jgi:hypothetical protein
MFRSKHVAENCKFIKYLLKIVLDYVLLPQIIDKNQKE